MESGEESSLTGSNEWWGPDLSHPTAGDQEYRPGTHTFEVSRDTWDMFLHRPKLRCEPPDMDSGYYDISEREVVEEFMTGKKTYLITVEFE